jgi:hypothetical protein
LEVNGTDGEWERRWIMALSGNEKEKGMVRILHIDENYKTTYLIFRSGASIKSTLSLKEAVSLLKTESFDLILSEPHNKAVLNPLNTARKQAFTVKPPRDASLTGFLEKPI